MSEKSKIGNHAKIRRGASPRPIGDPMYFGGTVGWVKISDVTSAKKYLRKTAQYVSPLGESLSVRVDCGDLIMSICATVGRPVIVDMPACIHDGFVQFYDVHNDDKEYMYYLLQFHEKDLERKGQPGTQVK
jgi:type I restriction enzyme S subunit